MGSDVRGLGQERVARAREATAALRSIESLLVQLATGPAESPSARPRASATALAWAGRIAMVLGISLALSLAALSVAPRLFPVQALVVLSGSMEPVLSVGSLILLEGVEAADIHVGDVITFARPDRPGELVTHRVIGEQTSTRGTRDLITKGDANAVADPWVVPAKGAGWRLTASLPLAGYVLEALRSGAARVALFVIPLVGLAAIALRAIWRGSRA